MEVKDFYSILGISEAASTSEIKRAYRDMAKRYHPDANPGDISAETRFKNISEAYDVLKDEEKRRKYDQLRRFGRNSENSDWFSFDPYAYRRQNGTSSFDGFQFSSGFKFTDMLREIFGFDDLARGHPPQTRQAKPAPPAQPVAELTINFEEAILGTSKLIQLSNVIPCALCVGAGYTHGAKCENCRGSGRIKEQKKIRIKIPAGVEDNHKMRLRGVAGDNHQRSGDVVVIVKVTPHKFFKKAGHDLLCEVPLTEELLLRGSRIRVSTIDGRKVEIRIPPGTPKGTVMRLPGLGVQDESTRGDQLIKII